MHRGCYADRNDRGIHIKKCLEVHQSKDVPFICECLIEVAHKVHDDNASELIV